MAERRGLNPSHHSGPPPVSGAIPVRIPQVPLQPMQCEMSPAAPAAPAALVEEWEATRQKKRKKHRENEEVAASSSESPRPPATPDSRTQSPAPVTAETLTSTEVAAGKGRKRKKEEVVAASSLVGEAVRKEEKRTSKRSKPEAAAATPSSSIPAAATATAQILEVVAEGAAAKKEQRRGKLEQGQSGQQPSPVDVHPQGGEAVVDGGVSGSKSVRRCSSGKPRVLTNKEILRERVMWLKEHPVPLPQGFFPAMPNPNYIDQDPKYNSPFGAFFYQFWYTPERQQGRNAPSLPKTPDPPARPPPRDHPSFLSSQLSANQKAAKTTVLNTKRPPSVSASGSREAVKAKEKKRPDEKMDTSHTMKTEMANPNSIDHNPKYSSPFGLFEKFCYIPERRRGHNAPSLPETPDPPARPPPRDHSSLLSSQLSANQKAAKTTILNTKRPPSVSASGSQEALKAKEKKRPDEKIDTSHTMKTEMANHNSIDHNPKYSSPFGLFEKFCYIPERRRGHSAPSLPKTPDPPARPPPRDHLSFLSSQLTANKKAAKTTTLSRKRPPSVSASGSQEAVKAQEKKRPDEKMHTMKQKTKKSLLSAAEKRSDMYRRLPLNQLVRPLCSPYELLQESYAHDPWKVIVICMLCNRTRGKETRKKLDGFFERYPDAQTACTADPEKMADYLAPLGLHRTKANRIQKMSKVYVKEEWTYVTELFGVGKYAADAYAIFCAGRATEVVPEDHELVRYWKYVCSQASPNAEEAAGVTEQGNFAPAVQQIAASC